MMMMIILFFSFIFYQFTALSTRAVDGHQMSLFGVVFNITQI